MAHLYNSDSRNGFLRRVYLLLSVQFTFIMLSSLVALLNRNLRTSLQNNIEVFVIMSVALLIMVAFGTLFALHRRVPWNIPMLILFTIGYCLLMATVSAASESYGTVFVFGTVATICLLIFLFSCVEKWNPLNWLSVIILLLVVVVFYIFALLFIKESPEIKCISLALSVVIILYLLIDTHLIMSRQSLKLESNEIVFAVLTLHLDGLTLLADELTNCPSNCARPCWRRRDTERRQPRTIHEDIVDVDPKKQTFG